MVIRLGEWEDGVPSPSAGRKWICFIMWLAVRMIQVQFYSLNCKICIIRSPLLWSHTPLGQIFTHTCDHNTMVYIRPRAHRLGAWFANSRPTLVLGIWWWGVNGLLSVKRELRWNSCVVWDSSMSYSTYATTDVHCDKSLFAACSWQVWRGRLPISCSPL